MNGHGGGRSRPTHALLRKAWLVTHALNPPAKCSPRFLQILKFISFPNPDNKTAIVEISDSFHWLKAILTEACVANIEKSRPLGKLKGALVTVQKYNMTANQAFSEFFLVCEQLSFVGSEGSFCYGEPAALCAQADVQEYLQALKIASEARSDDPSVAQAPPPPPPEPEKAVQPASPPASAQLAAPAVPPQSYNAFLDAPLAVAPMPPRPISPPEIPTVAPYRFSVSSASSFSSLSSVVNSTSTSSLATFRARQNYAPLPQPSSYAYKSALSVKMPAPYSVPSYRPELMLDEDDCEISTQQEVVLTKIEAWQPSSNENPQQEPSAAPEVPHEAAPVQAQVDPISAASPPAPRVKWIPSEGPLKVWMIGGDEVSYEGWVRDDTLLFVSGEEDEAAIEEEFRKMQERDMQRLIEIRERRAQVSQEKNESKDDIVSSAQVPEEAKQSYEEEQPHAFNTAEPALQASEYLGEPASFSSESESEDEEETGFAHMELEEGPAASEHGSIAFDQVQEPVAAPEGEDIGETSMQLDNVPSPAGIAEIAKPEGDPSMDPQPEQGNTYNNVEHAAVPPLIPVADQVIFAPFTPLSSPALTSTSSTSTQSPVRSQGTPRSSQSPFREVSPAIQLASGHVLTPHSSVASSPASSVIIKSPAEISAASSAAVSPSVSHAILAPPPLNLQVSPTSSSASSVSSLSGAHGNEERHAPILDETPLKARTVMRPSSQGEEGKLPSVVDSPFRPPATPQHTSQTSEPRSRTSLTPPPGQRHIDILNMPTQPLMDSPDSSQRSDVLSSPVHPITPPQAMSSDSQSSQPGPQEQAKVAPSPGPHGVAPSESQGWEPQSVGDGDWDINPGSGWSFELPSLPSQDMEQDPRPQATTIPSFGSPVREEPPRMITPLHSPVESEEKSEVPPASQLPPLETQQPASPPPSHTRIEASETAQSASAPPLPHSSNHLGPSVRNQVTSSSQSGSSSLPISVKSEKRLSKSADLVPGNKQSVGRKRFRTLGMKRGRFVALKTPAAISPSPPTPPVSPSRATTSPYPSVSPTLADISNQTSVLAPRKLPSSFLADSRPFDPHVDPRTPFGLPFPLSWPTEPSASLTSFIASSSAAPPLSAVDSLAPVRDRKASIPIMKREAPAPIAASKPPQPQPQQPPASSLPAFLRANPNPPAPSSSPSPSPLLAALGLLPKAAASSQSVVDSKPRSDDKT